MGNFTQQPATNVLPLDPTVMNPPLNTIKVVDEAGLLLVSDFLSRNSVYNVDVEFPPVQNWVLQKLRTIQLGNRYEQYVIDLKAFSDRAGISLDEAQPGFYKFHPCLQPVVSTLRPSLESNSHLKVGQNLQTEYEHLKFFLNIRSWNFYDTLLAEKCLWAGYVKFTNKGFWAVEDLVRRYCLREMADTTTGLTFLLDIDLSDPQVQYCGLDARLPMSIKDAQYAALTKANLLRAAQIEFDAIPAFGDMHLNGLLCNEDAWFALVKEVELMNVNDLIALDNQFIPVVGRKLSIEHIAQLKDAWDTAPLSTDERRVARAAYQAARKSEVHRFKKGVDTYEGEAAINYGSPQQLMLALRKMGFDKKRLPSTNKKIMKKVAFEPPIKALITWRTSGKILQVYGYDFVRENVNPLTGNIHSYIDQYGADTGRTTSKKPNTQNLLKGADWRGCFRARIGYKICTLDYNGCELRIMADCSQEMVWIKAFLKGWDVHSVGAEILEGKTWLEGTLHEPTIIDVVKDGKTKQKLIPKCAYVYPTPGHSDAHDKCECPVHKKLRGYIKNINFGLAYGLGVPGLAEALEMAFEDAKALYNRYKKAFPTITAWLMKLGEKARTALEARTMCQRRRGWIKPTFELATRLATEDLIEENKEKGIVNPNAKPTSYDVMQTYRGLFASIEREGKNMPIQGTNADMIKLAMGCGFDSDGKPYMWHRLEPDFGGLLQNMVHDELVAESPEEKAQGAYDLMAECMSRAGGEFVKSVPMTTDGHIADRWIKE